MKNKLFVLILICFNILQIQSQNDFDVYVVGLKAGDSAQVTLQKSSESLLQKWAKSTDGSDVNLTFSVGEGKWALSIDATGYTYPTAKIINIPTDSNATITLTQMQTGSFTYSWSDDDSAAGHSTQSYNSEPTEIVVLDKTVSVPNDYASIKLRNDFGVVLSDDVKAWSKEDSYRLYKMFHSLPFSENGEGNKVDFSTGEGVRGVFYLTDDEQYKDLTLTKDGDLVNATISSSAFTYATPLVVTIDGIKGKFYSKRLYHVVVNYITDFASNDEMVDWIADGSFGFRFMKPNDETETLMGEDSSNFQEFHDDEKMEILAMFEELPEGFHIQQGLKYMVRRINGQDHPKYKTAAAIAWTGNADYLEDNDTVNDSKMFVIEWMEKAFNSGNIGDLHRLILHEKAHFLWEYTFDDKLKDDWADIGGWFKDPTSASGWSTSNTTESVSAYAHLKNPNEDMAESIAFYITNPNKLLNVSVKKYEFIRDRVMHGTRYVAQIREDLTFTVYNLFPDYTFPGKVTSIDVEVTGEPEEDKQVKITAKLNSVDPQYDGASEIYARFSSSIGTIHDIRLNPVNGSVDSVLVGTTTFNKLEKSGYWTLAYFNVFDKVGNKRFENTSTLGLKLFINNPLEDVVGAQWNYDLEMKVVTDKFTGRANAGTFKSNDGTEMKAIEMTGSVYENRKMERVGFRIINPTLDDPNAQVYERQSWVSEFYKEKVTNDSIAKENEYESNKYIRAYMAVPEYYPSGYYSISMMNFYDKANNGTDTFFVRDTSDYFIDKSMELKQFKDVRDSIYVETKYPDYVKPEIDIDNIIITAEPTKPKAPDGETQVDITMLARDLSDFAGFESGVNAIDIRLRDPLGNEYTYNSFNQTMQAFQIQERERNDDYGKYGNSEWLSLDFRILLPQGSPPGKWGISSATVWDRAGNFRAYNFVEYVRFDVIESNIVLTSPLEIEILDKFINAKNVDSISAKMSCIPCKDLNYVYTIYSRMGGGGTVVRGEGKFESDTIVVNNIKTTGVLDGLVNLTVQVTDSTSALVATKTAEYLKDVVYPKSYYAKSNIQDQGWSNLDGIIIEIEVESQDVGGTYDVNVSNYDNNKNTSPPSSQFSQNDFSNVNLTGSITEAKFDIIKKAINFEKISSLQDGYIKLNLVVTDSVGNVGDPSLTYYIKKNNEIRYLGTTINPDSDEDADGIIFSQDNSPFFYNPGQEDVDNDGIGDWSDNRTILTSISEIFKSDTVSLSNKMLSSLRKIYNSERVINKIELRNINDTDGHLVIDTSSKKLYVKKDVSLDFFTKHLYDYKIGVHNTEPSSSEIRVDSLDLRIYVDMYKNERDVETQKNKLSNNLIQYKLINPYQIDTSDQSFFDKYGDIPTNWGGPDFETNAYFQDLNGDGFKDLIIGDYRVDTFGRFFNIHHVSEPVYITHDGSFNFKSRYNAENNNRINKSIIHSPNIKVIADLNNDGTNEIVNYGEEYHINYPPHHPHINYIHEWFKTKNLQYGTDFNEHGKKTRYYSISENGELTDQVSKIDISKTDSLNPNYLRNMYASTTGDIDSDGDIDLISSGVYWNDSKGGSYDIIKNDGEGNFTLESQQFSQSFNSSEGHMIVMDINGDNHNDVVFGGQFQETRDEYSIFGFFAGNGSTVNFQNPIVLEQMHPSLGLRSIFYEDINGDDVNELIAYFTVGFGCNGCGLKDDDIPNIVKIYELVDSNNGYLNDISDQYFTESQNMMNFYSQTSFMQYLDLDGDGYKDLVPKFSLEDPQLGWDYPNNAFRGNWNDSKGFQYFKFNKLTKKFEIIDLGQFNELHHYNNFDFVDLNNDKSLEWVIHNVHHSESALYIYEYFFDMDNDGIYDHNDQCLDTPSGVKVDVNGCEVFTMPVSNFKVEVAKTTCIGNSDGMINLSVEDATVDYTVTITGKDNVTITGDSKTASVSGLAKGTYTVCFKVDGQSNYEQCFDVVVGEPEKLNAFVSVDEDDKKLSITMSGSNVYNVEINGKRSTVSSNSFTTELNTGLSIIKVYTDLECQGSIEQEVFISEDIHYYPNPTDNDVKVHVGGEDQQVKVSVFTSAGALVYTQEQTIEDITRKTQIDLSKQQTGTYVVVMESKTVRKTFKIIRE